MKSTHDNHDCTCGREARLYNYIYHCRSYLAITSKRLHLYHTGTVLLPAMKESKGAKASIVAGRVAPHQPTINYFATGSSCLQLGLGLSSSYHSTSNDRHRTVLPLMDVEASTKRRIIGFFYRFFKHTVILRKMSSIKTILRKKVSMHLFPQYLICSICFFCLKSSDYASFSTVFDTLHLVFFVSLCKDKPGFCPCARTKYFLTLFHNSNCVSTRLKVI